MTAEDARRDLLQAHVELITVRESVMQTIREAQTVLFQLGRVRDAMQLEETATILSAAITAATRSLSSSALR